MKTKNLMKTIYVQILILMGIVKKRDYIPRGGADLNSWQLNFVAKVNLYKSSWSWDTDTTDEWVKLTTTADIKKLKFDAAWLPISSRQFTRAQEQKYKDARQQFVSGDKNDPTDTSIRLFVNRHLRYNPLVTNDQKRDMGLTVPDLVRTPTSDVNARLSGIELAGAVKVQEHLIQKSQVTSPGKRSLEKGEGVEEIEIFICIIDDAKNLTPPVPKLFEKDGEVKRGYYTRQFPEEKVGWRAWYKARKVIKGKTKIYGPFSDPWSAVIS